MNDRGLHDLSEDSTGFGRAELRTALDALIRPRQQLEIYMTGGSTGDGRYARPLRLYLTLCGLLMLVLFLNGGTETTLTGFSDEMLAALLETSGKSRDAFMADFDNWATLVLVPITCATYALSFAPLFRAWDPEDLGWRKGFRATFVFLNAATIPMLPFSWMGYNLDLALWSTLLTSAILLVTFLRMGGGRWYRSPLIGVLKGLALVATLLAAGLVSYLFVIPIGLLGAVLTP